jgi:hypothetical protein
VEKATDRAVVLGEWGGKYDLDGPVGDRDRVWQDSLGDFLVENCLVCREGREGGREGRREGGRKGRKKCNFHIYRISEIRL